MCDFHCDIDREKDSRLIEAIQTILDAISSLKNELKQCHSDHDQLKAQLQSVHDMLNTSHDIPNTPTSPGRRKRKKNVLNASGANISVDLNNAAFILSSTCGDDEEVIGPTQFSQSPSPSRAKFDRSMDSHRAFVDSNKENRGKLVKLSPNVAQTTIKTSKSSIITSVHKNSFDGAEISEEDELKSSERLFENWICKKSPRMVSAADTSKVVVKKKNRLSLVKSQNTANSKMRQSTITFQSATKKLQSDDETFCDEFLTFNQSDDDSLTKAKSSTSNSLNASAQDSVSSAVGRIKIEKFSPMCAGSSCKKSQTLSHTKDSKSRLKTAAEADMTSTSTNIIAEDVVNDIITLEDTQSVCSDNFFGSKTDSEGSLLALPTKKLGAYQPDVTDTHSNVVLARKVDQQSCPDCDKYQQVVGGAIGCNINAKDLHILNSKCSRHRHENACPSTPPNYWDPRIPVTPEGEHIETPFDYRFL